MNFCFDYIIVIKSSLKIRFCYSFCECVCYRIMGLCEVSVRVCERECVFYIRKEYLSIFE